MLRTKGPVGLVHFTWKALELQIVLSRKLLTADEDSAPIRSSGCPEKGGARTSVRIKSPQSLAASAHTTSCRRARAEGRMGDL